MSRSCENIANANRVISHQTPQAFYSVPSTSKVHLIKVASAHEHQDVQTWFTQPAGQPSKWGKKRRGRGGTLRHVLFLFISVVSLC